MVKNNSDMKLEKYAQELANDPEFIAETLSIKIVEEMLEQLNSKGANQTWLAEKMGVSRAHISKILNAQPNMTLLTIAKIAIALGVKPDVCLNSENKNTKNDERSKIDFPWLANDQKALANTKPGIADVDTAQKRLAA